LIAYGRSLPTWVHQPDYLYAAEGMNASVSVSEWNNGVRNFHVAGKVVASSEPQDMRVQRMLGHLPALIHARPRSVLVVGCGAGVTAGSFILYPDVERIVICEIEPLIPPAAAEYFGRENYHVLADPRVELVYDDARHYVVTTDEKFDIITSDPIHPWVKGAAALYSKEYFKICKRRLNPGGVITQWVPLYETNMAAVKSEMATFFHVFSNGTIWANDVSGEGYDVVLIGRNGEVRIDVDELQQRLDNDDYRYVHESLQQVELGWAVSLMGTYAGRGSDLGPWLKGAEINRDGNLRLQYLAGMGLNLNQSECIYQSLLAYRKYPESLFVAAGNRGLALKALLDKPPSSE
jgi:spermidine synthase